MSGQSVHSEVLDRVVAKINSDIVTLSEVEDRLAVLGNKYQSEGLPVPSRKELQKQAMDSIISEKLQLQEAKKLGMEVDDESVNKALDDIRARNNVTEEALAQMLALEGRTLESYKEHIRDQILVSRVTRFQMGNQIKISDAAIQRYYKSHLKDFWNPPKIKVRHILFIIDQTTSPKDRKIKEIRARQVLKKIESGEDFGTLAQKYSEDVSAASGGEIGLVERGKMVAQFEDAAFALAEGEISDLVFTPYGIHIIKVEKIVPGQPKEFQEVKEEIKMRLSFEKEKEIYEVWVAELKESAYIEITLDEKMEDGNTLDPSGSEETQTARLPATRSIRSTAKKNNDPRTSKQTLSSQPKSQKSAAEALAPSADLQDHDLNALENRLWYFKMLRDSGKISEEEYQKKKEDLLNRL